MSIADRMTSPQSLPAQILEHIADGVLALDRKGRVTYVNGALERRMGKPRSEIVGRTAAEVLPGVDTSVFQAHYSRASEEGVPVHFEARSPLDGIRLQASVFPMGDGIAAIVRDVTREREHEEQLARAEEHYRRLVETAPVGIVVVDLKLRILEVNAAMAEMLGRPEEELLGMDAGTIIVPHDLQQVADAGRRRANGEMQPLEWDCTLRRPDGDREGRLHTSPIIENGKMVGLHGVLTDLTDLKQTREELRRKDQELYHAQKMEAIGRLAGGVAHDYNNLLTVISGHAYFLASELPEGDPLLADVAQIQKAARRSVELTRQLLAFSRSQPAEPRTVDVNQVIEGVQRLVQRMLGEDARLRVELEHPLWPVRIDAGQLEQVLMNLLVNARDAMPDGGEIVLSTRNLRGDSPGSADRVRLTVRDTGVGMDEETRQRVFEPFFTTKAQGKGTGLGLSTAHGIVGQSGGSISVTSAPGEGATFTIDFPVDPDPFDASSAPADGEPDEAPHGTETVLVVEDDYSVRPLLASVLRKAGYRVLLASGGEEAAEICAQSGSEIDLLVTDVRMPGMSGPQVAELARRHRADLPVLFLSGYSVDDRVDHAMLASAPLLEKPFLPNALLRMVRAALDGTAG